MSEGVPWRVNLFAYLGHKNKAEGGRRTEDYKHRDEDERGVLPVGQHNGDGRSRNAHNYDIIHAQADVLGVVEGGNGDVPRFPCQESTKYLRSMRNSIKRRY